MRQGSRPGFTTPRPGRVREPGRHLFARLLHRHGFLVRINGAGCNATMHRASVSDLDAGFDATSTNGRNRRLRKQASCEGIAVSSAMLDRLIGLHDHGRASLDHFRDSDRLPSHRLELVGWIGMVPLLTGTFGSTCTVSGVSTCSVKLQS